MKERFYKVPAALGELVVGFTDKGISSLKFPSRRKTDGMLQLRGQERSNRSFGLSFSFFNSVCCHTPALGHGSVEKLLR